MGVPGAAALWVSGALAVGACESTGGSGPDAGLAGADARPAADAGGAPVWLDDPGRPFPLRMSEVGLYPALPDLAPVDGRVHAFEPVWPLWTNGSDKDRFLALPPGAVVDNRDRDAWEFPPGTVFFKTFSYRGDGDLMAPAIPVETRLSRRGAGGWDYAVYRWEEDGKDAVLLSGDVAVDVAVRAEDGEPFEHSIPSLLECRVCHEANRVAVIGFDELRLGSPLEGAPATQLEELAARGIWAVPPPSGAEPPDRIEHDDEATRRVLGYVHGNCAHCHDGGSGPSNAFDLRHPAMLASTIGQETEGSGSAVGVRIVPGDPGASVLFLALSGESDDPELQPMPPLAVQRRDTTAIEQMRTWIADLSDDPL